MKSPFFLRNNKLIVEISLCLLAKVILLTLLWWICFSHPVSEQQSQQKVSQIFQTHE